ncbi:unnamed protein product [Cunninghamella blakesleeana]
MIEVENKHHWAPLSSSQQQQQQQQQQSIVNNQRIPPDVLLLLRQHSLFQRTKNESFLEKLSCSMNIRKYNPHDIIITQGEPSKAMFFLLKGQVEVCSADFERVFATLPQGSCFGEIGILYSMPRTATVIASNSCIVAVLTSEQVHSLLPLYPDVEKIIRFEAEERLSMMKKSSSDININNLSSSSSITASSSSSLLQLPVSSSSSSSSSLSSSFSQQQLNNNNNNINDDMDTNSIDSDASTESRRRSSSYQQNIVSFSKTGIRDQLGKIPFFFGCSEEFLHLICLSIQPRIYEPNSLVFNQGDMGDEMFFIIDGTVTVETDTNIFVHMGPGDYFGELSVVLNAPRFATIKTVTTVEFFVLNRDNLQRICDMCPKTGLHIRAMAEKRLQNAKQGFLMPDKNQFNQDIIEPQSICSTTCDQDPTLPNATTASQIRKMETGRRRASIAVWSDPLLMEQALKHSEKYEKRHHPNTKLQQLNIKHYNDDEKHKKKEHQIIEGGEKEEEEEDDDTALLPPRSPLWAMPNTPPHESSFYTHFSKSSLSPTSTSPTSILSPNQSEVDEDEDNEKIKYKKEKKEDDKKKNVFTLLDKSIIARVMNYLDFKSLMQVMCVTKSVRAMFADDRLLRHIDLTTTHKKMTDERFAYLMPLIRQQMRYLSLSQCFHLTDIGFQSLVNNNDNNITNNEDVADPSTIEQKENEEETPFMDLTLDSNINQQLCFSSSLIRLQALNLNSCWLLTDKSLALLGEKCPLLIELDLSNCRKITNRGIMLFLEAKQQHIDQGVGKGLEWISLSYCKNLDDITMQHLATFTRDSLVSINLQRCTKISDRGFLPWTTASLLQDDNNNNDDNDLAERQIMFPKLKSVSLIDCSFLTDKSIQLITKAAPHLEQLSLSFCCALSDTSMVYLGQLKHLKDLDVSFCGAAVSDTSLNQFMEQQCLVKKKKHDHSDDNYPLEKLNIRGCCRITGDGIYPVIQDLVKLGLYELNITQCPSIKDPIKQKLKQLKPLKHLYL